MLPCSMEGIRAGESCKEVISYHYDYTHWLCGPHPKANRSFLPHLQARGKPDIKEVATRWASIAYRCMKEDDFTCIFMGVSLTSYTKTF